MGYYFVTICAKNRECTFGDVKEGEILVNGAGKMVEKWWKKLPDKYCGIEIDEYCVMPNHFHGIICIVGANPCVRPDNLNNGKNDNNFHGSR